MRRSAALLLAGIALSLAAPMVPLATLTSRAAAASTSIDVWWPADGATVSGIQPFKIMAQNMDVGSYRAFWQVDGDRENPMESSWQDYPHKEASVDLSGWTWHGHGPYTVTFVVRDTSGNLLASRSIHIDNGGVASRASSSSTSSSASSQAAKIATATSSSSSATPAPLARASGANPFAGATLYVNPQNDAYRQAEQWRQSRPDDARMILKIAAQPESQWFGNWNSDIAGDVRRTMDTVAGAGALPVFVAYNIPQRDCGGYSAGGSGSPDAYRAWIRGMADGIGSRRAVVLLEPDALAGMDCLSQADRDTRTQLLREAVQTFKAKGSIAVYIDAGHASWIGAEEMAKRLRSAGIDIADGFVLNISNFETDADTIRYGTDLSQRIGGKHFVYDSGRNGSGPTSDHQWCNPPDRSLGMRPTVRTGNALVDAVLWVKGPGGSDGQCNGGPAAGIWYPEYALGLARRAGW